jgi:hypothetical protein
MCIELLEHFLGGRMTHQLTPYSSTSKLVGFNQKYLIPTDWEACNVVIYLSGVMKLPYPQPLALAITPTALSLCNHKGPLWSLPLGGIRDVTVENLHGISFPISTPSGEVEMIPPQSFGVSVSYFLTISGLVGKLEFFSGPPTVARSWANEIRIAVYDHSGHTDFGGPIRSDNR